MKPPVGGAPMADAATAAASPATVATPLAAGLATATPAAAARPANKGSKFTVVLTDEDAATFDQLALDVRRRLGRRVVKGDLVRALVALAADDTMLRDQVIAELRAKTG